MLSGAHPDAKTSAQFLVLLCQDMMCDKKTGVAIAQKCAPICCATAEEKSTLQHALAACGERRANLNDSMKDIHESELKQAGLPPRPKLANVAALNAWLRDVRDGLGLLVC
jgi:hypothetical protein